MNLIEQINARIALVSHTHERLPFSLGYKIMKVLKATEDDLNFYQGEVNRIIEACAERTPEGGIVRTPDGHARIQNGKADECNKMIRELESTEVAEPNIKFTTEELSTIQFTVDELFALDHYIQQG